MCGSTAIGTLRAIVTNGTMATGLELRTREHVGSCLAMMEIVFTKATGKVTGGDLSTITVGIEIGTGTIAIETAIGVVIEIEIAASSA